MVTEPLMMMSVAFAGRVAVSASDTEVVSSVAPAAVEPGPHPKKDIERATVKQHRTKEVFID